MNWLNGYALIWW